ncbi:MAG: alkaline phosphatase family protein [Actinomycetota bacterium]
MFRKGTASLLATSGVVTLGVVAALTGGGSLTASAAPAPTWTPIKHLVVIFDENVSFDHYFGTYPNATNPAGAPAFRASASTPSVNGLANQLGANGLPTGSLLTSNPNESNPMLLGPADAMTCDQDHGYTTEQLAADHGAEDMYIQQTGNGLTLAQCLSSENGT